MVSISTDGNHYALHFLSTSKCCTFDLGKATLQAAEQAKRCIEVLLASKESGKEPDTDTTLWLICLNDALHTQLVDAGLVPARPSMESVVEGYLGMFTAGRTILRDCAKITWTTWPCRSCAVFTIQLHARCTRYRTDSA
jgi:hypothetical protein